jgi:two-component system, OmpR family, phosphate regulon sensor histidine kinase PhoR
MNVVKATGSGRNAEDPSNLVLQKIIESTRECVLVVNEQMRIVHYNAPAADAFGREIIGLDSRRLSEVIRDLDIHAAFRQALDSKMSDDVMLELTAEKRRFEVHIAPIELYEENYAIGFFHETTHIDRLETIRQEFLSNISHELRTPLTSILAFIETLENGGLNDQQNNLRFLQVIRRNAQRMHRLIADILELSLIESGNVDIEFRQVALAVAVEEVITALSAKAAETEITVVNNIPESVIVLADPLRLEQMMTNLIDNAIKFNHRGGEVTISCEHKAGRVVAAVCDTGEGIPPEHVHRIFERLYRADRSRAPEGTGLGLAIVKHLARLHGGEVKVTSRLGSGTTFCIDLPPA